MCFLFQQTPADAMRISDWCSDVCSSDLTDYPPRDLRLFRFPYFRSAIVAGAAFRLGQGATPFLFPLMLQLIFGMTPFESSEERRLGEEWGSRRRPRRSRSH